MNYYLILLLIFMGCTKTYDSQEPIEDIHNQISTDVEITLTEQGNMKALIKSQVLERDDGNSELKLKDNVKMKIDEVNTTTDGESDIKLVSIDNTEIDIIQ